MGENAGERKRCTFQLDFLKDKSQGTHSLLQLTEHTAGAHREWRQQASPEKDTRVLLLKFIKK